VAAALWFPYRAAPADAVLRWAATSLDVFAVLAEDPSTGVALRPGTVEAAVLERACALVPELRGARGSPSRGAVHGTSWR
jgi:D-amino-acid oxidase